MFIKTKLLFIISSIIFTLFFGELFYLFSSKNKELFVAKRAFVHMSTLPDLAIYNEDRYLRHRSLYGVGEIYNVDGVLREYNKGSFVLDWGDRGE